MAGIPGITNHAAKNTARRCVRLVSILAFDPRSGNLGRPPTIKRILSRMIPYDVGSNRKAPRR
jgi:hypothetical protein